MFNDIRVIIVEDDPFARNWMALLAARDLRTRVVGEVDGPSKLLPILKKEIHRVDIIILDTETPRRENWMPRILKTLNSLNQPPALLCTGIKADERVLQHLSHPFSRGYILKDEVKYSLAWAIALAVEGNWVITSSIQALASSMGFTLPKPCLVLEGRYAVQNLTKHQANAARLAFLFSMERRDLADELGVSEDWGYGLVSAVYKKLGLKDFLSGDVDPVDYFGNHKSVASYFKRIIAEFDGTGKASDMETLAFYLLTMPEITELK